MKYLLIFVPFALIAQTPVISGVTVDPLGLTHTSAAIYWTTNISAGTDTIKFNNGGTYTGIYNVPYRTYSGLAHRIILTGLAPNTLYSYSVCSNTGLGTQACSTPGTFTTLVAPTNRKALPVQPINVPTNSGPPTINGSTFTVASDCSNLQSQLNAAALANTALNHEVVIPAGTSCANLTTSYSLPAKTGSGVVVVHPNTPVSSFAPVGVRISSNFPDSLFSTILSPSNAPTTAGLTAAANTNGWYFWGIKFSNSYRAGDYLTITNASYTTPIQITTSTNHGLSTNAVVQIDGVVGNTAANRFNWKITVTGLNTFTLNNSSGNGNWVSGGRVAVDPQPQSYFINFGNTNTNIIFDRCRFQGYGFPTRTQYALFFGDCTGCAIINSEVKDLGVWVAVDPDGGINPVVPVASVYGAINLITVAFEITQLKNALIDNNLITTPGISVFSQGTSAATTVPTNNLVIKRNTFNWDNKYKLTSDLTAGVYYTSRQPLEFKRGYILLIKGNDFANVWINGITGNYQGTILFTPRNSDGTQIITPSNYISNITFINNYIHGGTSGITLGGVNGYNSVDPLKITSNVLISNNFFSLNGNSFSYGPYTGPTTQGSGCLFYFYDGMEDWNVQHNTLFSQIGKTPVILVLDGQWGSGLTFSNNLTFVPNIGGSFPPLAGAAGTNLTPTFTTTTAYNRWQTTLVNGPGVSDTTNSFLGNNLFIPTLIDASTTANYGDISKAWSVANCNTFWAGFTNTCLGTDPTTANTKIAAVNWYDWANANLLFLPNSPAIGRTVGDRLDAGANWSMVNAAIGNVQNTRVLNITTTSAVVAYLRPGDVSCTTEWSTSPIWGTGTRQTDSGPILDETTYVSIAQTLSPLISHTTYYYRVMCPVQQISGSFSTNP